MTVRLRNSVEIPLIGVGTFRLKGNTCRQSIEAAATAVYEFPALQKVLHIDTASVYNNETIVGETTAELKRKWPSMKYFITSKLQPRDMISRKAMERAFFRSLKKLNVERIDLYLIHWPGCSGHPSNSMENRKKRVEAWRFLEYLYEAGLVSAIGVSNFTVSHLEDLEKDCGSLPLVNQVEFHPLYPQRELLHYCRSRGINLIAYGSLGQGELLNNRAIHDIASKHKVSDIAVLLKFAISQGIPVIPSSKNKQRIHAFFHETVDCTWTFDGVDYARLEELGKINRKFCWDPTNIK